MPEVKESESAAPYWSWSPLREMQEVEMKWQQSFLLDNPAAHVHLDWLRRASMRIVWSGRGELAHL